MPHRAPVGKSFYNTVIPKKEECPHKFIGKTGDGNKYCQDCMKIFNWRGDEKE